MKGSARSGLSGNPSAPRRSSTTIPTPRPRPSVSQRSQELSTSSSSVPFSRSLPSSLSTCGIDRRRSTNESDRWRRAKQKKRSVVLYSLFECIIIIQDSNRPNFQVFFFNFQFFSIADSRFFFLLLNRGITLTSLDILSSRPQSGAFTRMGVYQLSFCDICVLFAFRTLDLVH